MNIKCLLFGHKKYRPQTLGGADVIEVKDILDKHLFGINVCDRCGAVYSDLRSPSHNKE